MPTTGNKKVTQLIELSATEIQPDDLFLIIDVTARESKKIKVSELSMWMQGSGSTSEFSSTASYIFGSGVHGQVTSANTSNTSISASAALFSNSSLSSISSSYALTASYAMNGGGVGSISSSYLIYTGTPNGTSSYSIKSILSDTSTTALNLLYTGGDNGTASYAITTQNVAHTTSDTASYLSGTGPTVATASYALVAEAMSSGVSMSSSYLIFSPNNGTASYAMSAQNTVGITGYGIFLANTQSISSSQLDNVNILWSTLGSAKTPIEVMGTVIIPYTSSNQTNGTIYLSLLDRNTGMESILDSTPISFIMSPTVGSWGNYTSGSVKQTFSLMGQGDLYGSYLVRVSASNDIQIDSTRTVRFNISSETDTFSTYITPPIRFSTIPSTATFSFTSIDGGPFTDVASGIAESQSLGRQIFTINGINNGALSVDYLWTLTNLTESNFSNNFSLSNMSGIPSSLDSLKCSFCGLSSFYTFESSSLSIFDCSSNLVSSLPNFPESMSYINCRNNSLTTVNLPLSLSFFECSFNSITSLPDPLPHGLSVLYSNNNLLTSVPTSFPNSLETMSFDNNPSLSNLFLVNLPSSLTYFSSNNTGIGIFPSVPSNVLYLSLYSCSLSGPTIDGLTTDLVNNGLLNGILDLRGNGLLSPIPAQSNILILNSNGWTTLHD